MLLLTVVRLSSFRGVIALVNIWSLLQITQAKTKQTERTTLKVVEGSLSLKGMKSCEMDCTLNRESEKFRRVDEALKGHVSSVSMRENIWK